MELVRRLEELGEDDVDLAGGKGARLGALARGGFAVPPGFVLLSPAYEMFAEANELSAELRRLAGQVEAGDPSSADRASAAMRVLFERATMPDLLVQAILSVYLQMGEGPVAIRSSATGEDSPDASFAGQQESFLNVVGSDRVLAAVRQCWSSLWTPRAIAYRAGQALDSGMVGMAVVVQRMVPAETAGVLFTVNPVTGARDEMVINAAWGLGEAVVGGRVTPDTVVVEKVTGTVRHVDVGDKAVMTVSLANGTDDRPVDAERRRQAALTPDQIAELARLGREIESYFGRPQDIEWAIAGGEVHVLQSRPVTRLPSAPSSSPAPEGKSQVPGDDDWDRQDDMPAQPFDLWTRTNFGENLPFPVTPLTATVMPTLFAPDSSSKQEKQSFQMARRFYGRLYVNEGGIMHSMSEDWGLPSGIIDAMWGSRRRGQHRSKGSFRPLRLLRRLPALLRMGLNQAKKREPKQTPEELFARFDGWVSDSTPQDLSRWNDRELQAEGLAVWRARGAKVLGKYIALATPALITFALLERLVGWFGGRREIAHDLVTGLSGIHSAEVDPALWRMAQSLREAGLTDVVRRGRPDEALTSLRNTEAAQPVLTQLEAFLQRHGHRCPNEVELLNPRWSEDPQQVIALLAGYLGSRGRADVAEAQARRRREDAVVTVEARLGPLRRAIFRSVLAKAQSAVRLRDNGRHYVTKFYFATRRLYAHLGQRWTDRGWLSEPEDIFFLTVPEIDTLIATGSPCALKRNLPAVVAARRAAFDYWYQVVAPEVIGPDGAPVVEPADDRSYLQGVAASGGRACGTARLVHDPREAARLRTGDILVTMATDPGWTPVFPLVSGLVLEIGGQLSHGAIVAREYGVPAVVNVQGALRRIRDGQTVVVDGTTGRVYLCSSQQSAVSQ